MKITIVGGSGFIGTNLIKQLQEDEHYSIANIDKASSSAYPRLTRIADIRDVKQLSETIAPTDWCVLLAAEHRDDVSPESLYFDVNVSGNSNVLNELDNRGVKKIIFTSTVAIYGLNKQSPDENFPAQPFNAYGESKWQAEELLRAWYQKDPKNRTLIILRPTVVFGPGNRGNVYNLLKQIASGKFLMVGNGDNRKSMAFVDNITGFMKYCIDNDMSGYHLFNYADKPDLTMNDLVAIAEASLGRKLPPVKIPYLIGYLGGLCFDILRKVTSKKYSISSIRVKKFCANTQYEEKAVDNLGYRPLCSLREGLARTIEAIAIEEGF